MTNIIKKNNENDLILKILLNDNQRNLLQLLKKPKFDNKLFDKQKKLEKADDYEENLYKSISEYYSLNPLTSTDELLLNEVKKRDKITNNHSIKLQS